MGGKSREAIGGFNKSDRTSTISWPFHRSRYTSDQMAFLQKEDKRGREEEEERKRRR
jgi:hypothetical protein